MEDGKIDFYFGSYDLLFQMKIDLSNCVTEKTT